MVASASIIIDKVKKEPRTGRNRRGSDDSGSQPIHLLQLRTQIKRRGRSSPSNKSEFMAFSDIPKSSRQEYCRPKGPHIMGLF